MWYLLGAWTTLSVAASGRATSPCLGYMLIFNLILQFIAIYGYCPQVCEQ